MAEPLVLDSSAALAVLLGEPDADEIKARLVAGAGGPVLVVELFWLELANVLVRRDGWDADAVVAAIRELDGLGIETVALDRPLLLAALDDAVRHAITVYDAAYLAVTVAADATLLTLDESLARAAGDRSALPARRGTRERRAGYDAARGAMPDWARHGRYLAELRRATGT
jgi:predicted nucleic acid-binding protein